jgi:hypothetical protein
MRAFKSRLDTRLACSPFVLYGTDSQRRLVRGVARESSMSRLRPASQGGLARSRHLRPFHRIGLKDVGVDARQSPTGGLGEEAAMPSLREHADSGDVRNSERADREQDR